MIEFMNYTDSLARIWVEVGDTSRSGTAFPISGHLLLTAAHLFEEDQTLQDVTDFNFPSGEDARHQIFVRFAPFDETGECKGKLLWCGTLQTDEKFDVAVIAIEKLPDTVKPIDAFSSFNPTGDWNWEVAGFSKAGRRDEQFTKTPIAPASGSGNTWPTATENLLLEISQGSDQVDQWPGASGGPVMNRTTNELIGVQSGVDSQQGRLRAHVVPLSLLLKIDSFVTATGYDGAVLDQIREDYTKRIVNKLNQLKDSTLDERLKRHLDWERAEVDVYASRMVVEADFELIDNLTKCYRDAADKEEAHHWEEIIDYLLPILFPVWSICSFVRQARSSEPTLLEEPFASEIGAILGISAENSKNGIKPTILPDNRNRSGYSSRSQLFLEKAPLGDPQLQVETFIDELAALVVPQLTGKHFANPQEKTKTLATHIATKLKRYPSTKDGRAFCVLELTPLAREPVRRLITKLSEFTAPDPFPLIFVALCDSGKFFDVEQWEMAIPEWLAPRYEK